MANTVKAANGFFGGRALVQQQGSIGGARHVFAKIDDIKNDLVFPTFGGRLTNPVPTGPFKIYAGDLFEFKTDGDGNGQTVTWLRTFRVAEKTTSKKYIPILKKFGHRPFVGEVIGLQPESVLEVSPKAWVITRVEDLGDQWHAYTTDSESPFDLEKDEVLVELGSDEKMLVKKVNAVAAWDYDCMYSASSLTNSESSDAGDARYFITPSLRGTMIESKMSPLPKAIKHYNLSNIDGWFRVDALNKPAAQIIVGVE